MRWKNYIFLWESDFFFFLKKSMQFLLYLIVSISLVSQSLAPGVPKRFCPSDEVDIEPHPKKLCTASCHGPPNIVFPEGEFGRMPGSPDPTLNLFFEYQSNPAVKMDSIEDVIHELGEEDVDFLLVKLSKAVSEAMSNKEYVRVMELLKGAYLPAKKYSIVEESIIPIGTVNEEEPVGVFHHDKNPATNGLNFWIPTKNVKGRPLAFVKSSTLSESQKITNLLTPNPYPELNEANKYIFVPDMKGPGGNGEDDEKELGDMLVFRPDHVYHGSPELIIPNHQGVRDVIVFIIDYMDTVQ
jgi:hypothetical protein